MTRNTIIVSLLCGSAFLFAAPATAQSSAPEADQTEPVQSDAEADAVIASAQPVDTAQAQIQLLQEQVTALQEALEQVKASVVKATPSWKGAPEFADKEASWSFKPFGRIQYDAGWVGRPDGLELPGLGFANELRRVRIGVEGSIPGGFGYKAEVDLADNAVEITDAFLSYKASDELGLVLGQHNNFQSLEELTSSRFTSFIERAAFTDAFNFERRVGLSATWSKGDLTASAGLFSDNINDLIESDGPGGRGDENNSIGADARVVYAPKLAGTQLHLGGSAHWRNNGDINELGVTTRYRQRPLVHTTDERFLATPALNVGKETHYGLELAAIRGPLHAAGEVHWLNADRANAAPTANFFGGYAEVGYFLTGESRGYKGGRFDRTKVLKPLGADGWGALQLNLRYDHLDLNDGAVRGGRQNGYQASLIWIPQDYVRFMLNYARLDYRDAAIAAEGGDRNYGIDVVGARAQVDF